MAFQIGAYLVGLPLVLAIMVVLLRGQWKLYPFVFIYLIGDFLTTVLEIEPSLGYGTGTVAERLAFTKLYWINEWIMQVLVFLVVISLLYRATAHLRPRRTLLLLVVVGILAVAGVSFLVHYDPNSSFGHWMTPWTRDIWFFAVILDLGLWTALLGARQKDYKLLMITGALGIQFTGVVIGHAIRQLDAAQQSQLVATLTGDFISLANIGCSYVWWQAFRMSATVPAKAQTAASSPTAQR